MKRRKWIFPVEIEKKCSKCGIKKNFDEFYNDKHKKDGKYPNCIRCSYHYQKRAKTRSPTTPQKQRESEKRWRMANREKFLEIQRAAQKRRRLSPKNNLNNKMACSIGHSLRGNKKGNHWETIVGYSIAELMRHLEKNFLPGMTWNNRNLWEIDHRIPISVFNFEKPEDIDFRKCWALKNLFPLWKVDNRIKGAKLDKPFQPSFILSKNE